MSPAEQVATKIAIQIEAQTKPPRMVEPGWDGKVNAKTPEIGEPANGQELIRIRRPESIHHWQTKIGLHYKWTELKDPVLIRDGIDVLDVMYWCYRT